MDQDIFNKLSTLLQAHLDVNAEQITPEARPVQDLGADSLDLVELVMGIEEEFGIDILDEEAQRVEEAGTVRAWVEYIEQNTD